MRQQRDNGRSVTGADVHKQFPHAPRDGARVVRQVETELEALYDRARRAAARSLHQREPDFVRRLPKTCPYDWQAVWDRDVMAEGGIDLSGGAEEGQKTRRGKRGA